MDPILKGEIVGRAAVGRGLLFWAMRLTHETEINEANDLVEVVVASPEVDEKVVRWLKRDAKLGDRYEISGIVSKLPGSAGTHPKTADCKISLRCTCAPRPLQYLVRDNTGVARLVEVESPVVAGGAAPPLPMPVPAPLMPADGEVLQHGGKSLAMKRERAEVVARFIVATFGRDTLTRGGVVDVAGGRGELSFAFAKEGIPTLLVDPRAHAGRLCKRLRKEMRRFRPERPDLDCWHAYWPPPTTTPQGHEKQEGSGAHLSEQHRSDEEESALQFVQNCSLVCGLHPDEATEGIVDWALAHDRAFCVIPCCVFARLFPARHLIDAAGVPRAVRSHEDLCRYLCAKRPGSIRRERLGFQGMDDVLYYNPVQPPT